MGKRLGLTKRQLSRRHNLRVSVPQAEQDDPEMMVLDALRNAGRIGYREALAAYAKGYGAATLSRIAAESALGGIRASLEMPPEVGQAERGNAAKVAPFSPKTRNTDGSSRPEPPRFPARLAAVFSEPGPRCSLCGRGIKARGGIEIQNAGQWWPCCRDCKGRAALTRAPRKAAA